MTNPRVARGRVTQRLVAQWFAERGWPAAKAIEAFLPGVDVVGVHGYSIEVKATNRGDLLSALRQAAANKRDGDLPVVVWRPNGYGPAQIGQWVVALRLEDFTTLMQDRLED